MHQQKAASTVLQRLPAIVEDCCKITDLIQFKRRLHAQLIRGDKGSKLRNCPSSKFSCQGDNQITGKSMFTSVRRGGAVLSFQMVGITLPDFFFYSSFESVAILCPITIDGLKNTKLLELLKIEPHFCVGRKAQNGYFSKTPWPSAGQQDSTYHIVSFCFQGKGILRMHRKPSG